MAKVTVGSYSTPLKADVELDRYDNIIIKLDSGAEITLQVSRTEDRVNVHTLSSITTELMIRPLAGNSVDLFFVPRED
jgi:hypothetical protein